MPSRALASWQTRGRKTLDEVEAAHAAVGGERRVRRFAMQQINQAYVVLLSSQFQRFCRDLHREAADHLTRRREHAPLNTILRNLLTTGRRLDAGNATPANIGSDFGRLGLPFWDEVRVRDQRNVLRQQKLEMLNRWRNAVAHQDFRDPVLGGREEIRLAEVREWRRACDCLAVEFDIVVALYLKSVLGSSPW